MCGALPYVRLVPIADFALVNLTMHRGISDDGITSPFALVEFEDMNRAVRHDTFGQSIDTICGPVRGKNTSGAETGKRAFRAKGHVCL
ncbi:MAG: hypothetical protein WBZ23_25730, partial [Pseudolabrys sp.]